jgi:hypothetical protein
MSTIPEKRVGDVDFIDVRKGARRLGFVDVFRNFTAMAFSLWGFLSQCFRAECCGALAVPRYAIDGRTDPQCPVRTAARRVAPRPTTIVLAKCD